MAGTAGRSLTKPDLLQTPRLVGRKSVRAAGSVSALVVLTLALSACSQSSRFNQGGTLPPQQARPLAPAPLPKVNEGTLGPATGAPAPSDVRPIPPTPETPEVTRPATPSPQTEVASVDPSASAQPVTRQGMVGAWTVSTGGSNCQIFLALTKWSGGYRAASRGCTAAALKQVQAWDVKGKQVVLVNASGSTAATLFRSSGERFDGSTSSGGSISFSR